MPAEAIDPAEGFIGALRALGWDVVAAPTVCPRCGWRSEPWPEHPPADLLDFMRPVEVPK